MSEVLIKKIIDEFTQLRDGVFGELVDERRSSYHKKRIVEETPLMGVLGFFAERARLDNPVPIEEMNEFLSFGRVDRLLKARVNSRYFRPKYDPSGRKLINSFLRLSTDLLKVGFAQQDISGPECYYMDAKTAQTAKSGEQVIAYAYEKPILTVILPVSVSTLNKLKQARSVAP